MALLASSAVGMLIIPDIRKKFNIFGKTEQAIDVSSPDWRSQNWAYSSYVKTSTKTEKPGSGIFQGQFTNGEFSGVKLSVLDVISGSLGIENGNARANLKISLFGHSIEVNTGIRKDGIDVSAGADNGHKGYDIGLNLSPDLANGLVGAYAKNRTITTADNGLVTTQTLESGFRILNWQELIVGGLVLSAPIWVPVVGISTSGVIATASALIVVNFILNNK
ncbi:hypothetical protein MKL26_07060 [Streptococcus suis]|nr:hypothetical protein [Streptococcus suis]